METCCASFKEVEICEFWFTGWIYFVSSRLVLFTQSLILTSFEGYLGKNLNFSYRRIHFGWGFFHININSEHLNGLLMLSLKNDGQDGISRWIYTLKHWSSWKMIHCTTPTKRFLLLQMLDWKVEMADCYHIKREAGLLGGGQRCAFRRDATRLARLLQPFVSLGRKNTCLWYTFGKLSAVASQMCSPWAALQTSSCCFNEQMLRFSDSLLQRVNSAPRWSLLGTIYMY